jgi:hypothetical protein
MTARTYNSKNNSNSKNNDNGKNNSKNNDNGNLGEVIYSHPSR